MEMIGCDFVLKKHTVVHDSNFVQHSIHKSKLESLKTHILITQHAHKNSHILFISKPLCMPTSVYATLLCFRIQEWPMFLTYKKLLLEK